MKSYSCGTCGSDVLVILGGHETWALRCGNGHPLYPSPGFRLELQLRHEGAIVVPHVTTVKISLPITEGEAG